MIMDKIWTKNSSKALNVVAEEFNKSIKVDARMYVEDITGSISHVNMLMRQNIIPSNEGEKIVQQLQILKKDLSSGNLSIDYKSEDIHSFVESYLIQKLGNIGKKVHTGRSRNDQVTTDLKLYLRKEIDEIISLLHKLIGNLIIISEKHISTIMPGYTHMQRAQPVTFAHYMLAYAMMFDRDIERLQDCSQRMNKSPLGLGALAGTTYNIDRKLTAAELGFNGIVLNSLDGVSDRDYCAELNFSIALIMMHLSRFSEELITWSTMEFGFIKLSDEFTTGSSMMPQKKNPDIAELIRGKTGRAYGNLITILTILKSLPLAYNKDLQEDKESVFDSIDTVKNSLIVFEAMICGMTVNCIDMKLAAKKGFINATDLADYLVKKGMAFRDAYILTGDIISYCNTKKCDFESLSIKEYKNFSDLFEEDLYTEISLETCINKRLSEGAPSAQSIKNQISYLTDKYKLKF